ncbi:MAG: tol-pal system YbgF family protein [Planctomycetota bacterium]
MKSPSPRSAALLAQLAVGALAFGGLSAGGLRAQIELPGEGVQPGAHIPPVAPVQVQNPFRPFDRDKLVKEARALGATDLQIETFDEDLEEIGAGRAADDLMRKVVPAFDEAVTAAEDGELNAALALSKVLVETKSSLLQAHVRYHLARLFLRDDDPEESITILNEYLGQNLNWSPLDAEAAYFYAQSLAEIPLPDAALPRFRAFLAWFPNASERLRSAAHQRVIELEQERSRLHTLADGMKKSERDLRKKRTDKPVQVDQESYVEELQELIEMFEEMEKQSSGPASGNGPSQGPAASSALPEGDGSAGTLTNRPSVEELWDPTKDAERKKIMADVNKSMPPRYRKMLESYYKKLGKAQRK